MLRPMRLWWVEVDGNEVKKRLVLEFGRPAKFEPCLMCSQGVAVEEITE